MWVPEWRAGGRNTTKKGSVITRLFPSDGLEKIGREPPESPRPEPILAVAISPPIIKLQAAALVGARATHVVALDVRACGRFATGHGSLAGASHRGSFSAHVSEAKIDRARWAVRAQPRRTRPSSWGNHAASNTLRSCSIGCATAVDVSMFQTVTVIGDFRDHVKSQSLTRCRRAALSADEAGHTWFASTSIIEDVINFRIVAIATHCQDAVVL